MKSFDLTTKIHVYSYEDCTGDIKNIIDKAKSITEKAYAPYSGFHVGAAILLANGEIITGNNQENAAYPSGLCAERVALFYANAQYPDIAIEAIAIAGYHDGDFTKEPCSPCGSCRQALLELEDKHKHPIRVIMYGKNKIYELESVNNLLPLSFGKDSLSE